MRFFLGVALATLAIAACFNVTPNPPAETPPTVVPPYRVCPDATSPPDASDDDADANAPIFLDAGDITPTCAPPPSVCADKDWLAYWEQGTCVDQKCEYVTQYQLCNHGCFGSGCTQVFTAGGSGGF